MCKGCQAAVSSQPPSRLPQTIPSMQASGVCEGSVKGASRLLVHNKISGLAGAEQPESQRCACRSSSSSRHQPWLCQKCQREVALPVPSPLHQIHRQPSRACEGSLSQRGI